MSVGEDGSPLQTAVWGGVQTQVGGVGEKLSAFSGKGVMGFRELRQPQSPVIGSSHPEGRAGGEGRKLRPGRAGLWPGQGWSPASSFR